MPTKRRRTPTRRTIMLKRRRTPTRRMQGGGCQWGGGRHRQGGGWGEARQWGGEEHCYGPLITCTLFIISCWIPVFIIFCCITISYRPLYWFLILCRCTTSFMTIKIKCLAQWSYNRHWRGEGESTMFTKRPLVHRILSHWTWQAGNRLKVMAGVGAVVGGDSRSLPVLFQSSTNSAPFFATCCFSVICGAGSY